MHFSAHVLFFINSSAKVLWRFLPLDRRIRLAIWIDKYEFFPGIHNLSMALIRDWAQIDSDAYHRFLWNNHLGYARMYENARARDGEFCIENFSLTKKMLFADLSEFLLCQSGTSGQHETIESILEVGCSSGYLLRFIETNLFPEARILEGIDIDKDALKKGTSYLNGHSSKIRLSYSDMECLDQFFGEIKFDLILCAGVLMYLQEKAAANVIQMMLKHCKSLIVLAGLAHPLVDNAELEHSETRSSDGAFIHNFDRMIKESGGIVVYRRWEGAKTYDSQSVYFVFCQPKKDRKK
jgi:SAM-dependent methyltransferase